MTCEAFVYLWYDVFKKRFYVGSHAGLENDGYVCSSRAMMRAYRKRPECFKRRIIKRCSRDEQHLWEQYYLNMIKDNELFYKNKKYYNIKRIAAGGDTTANLPNRKEVIQRRYGKKHSDGIKRAIQKRSEEKKRLHQERRLVSLMKILKDPLYTNYQDKPYHVFVNGVFYKEYKNKKQFAKENKCDLSEFNKRFAQKKWVIKQRRNHPFNVGDVLTFEYTYSSSTFFLQNQTVS